tara:strand:+ start:357 stop:671 length:315 start_codon:yes stop_codon:yes gene_type:complete
MKVKISYTMDSDQVPGLINQILAKCKQKLLEHSDIECDIYQVPKFAERVNEAIRDMEIISEQLIDCVNIAIGISDLKQKVKRQEEELIRPEAPDVDMEKEDEPD